ncbi:MAG: N-acetylmuramoyl-L-alanine amidase [Eubacterium sp.]|nr:N-acetylmuramoyl-L-alanine amidase [Eubacterium sp.]
MKAKIKRIMCSVLAAAIILPTTAVLSQAENDAEEANEIVTEPQTVLPNLSLSNNLKATVLSLSDFSEDKFSEEFTARLETLADYGLNGIYIDPYGEDVSYYNTDMNAEGDRLELALDATDKLGFQKFVYFDIGRAMSGCPEGNDKNNYLVTEAHKFAIKYHSNGIILTGYYSPDDNGSYSEYMLSGSGIGYKNWQYDIVEYRFKIVSDVIRLTDNTLAVGLSAEDVWANSSEDNEYGSSTDSSFEAYYNGYADTKGFAEKGYVDFISIDASGSLSDENADFESVCTWWDGIAGETEMPVYVVHHNEKIGTNEPGWNAEDQLLRQLAVAGELSSYSGSVFYSADALDENPLGTTDTLVKYYNDQINVESLFEDLQMTSPYYLNYSTDESSVAFMGTFDNNFDVLFDGEKLELNEAGNFYFEQPLNVGMNTFTIEHKGKTYEYNIERTINVLKSINSAIAEGKTMSVDGGTSISLSCVAYKGATVTATLNGKTVSLSENTKSDDIDENSSYARFTGSYTVPAGIEDVEQYLGNLSLTASYAGYSRTYIGAAIYVNAIKRPSNQAQVEMEIPADQSSFGTGEVVGRISPTVTEDMSATYVRLLTNYTDIYDAYSTNSACMPNVGQLPAGTLDYYQGQWDEFYITTSGKRFYMGDCEILYDYGIGENNLVVSEIGNAGGDSFIKMQLDERVSFTVSPAGNTYSSGYNGDWYLDSFTANYVYITFDNITQVTALPSFENCTMFSAGEWKQVEVGGVPKFRLVLKLRQPGVYAGNSATYDSNGNLVFKFEILTNDLRNMTVVIDPGHGVTEYGYIDPGAIGHIEEQGVNLAVAKRLEEKLKAMGVNVVRLQTESKFYSTGLRPVYGRDYGCDMYIAIHSNKAADESARGTECYYFTSWSQPYAEALSKHVASYFSNYVYYDGAYLNRGDQYSTMWTTMQQDFPSVLIEMAFVSNYEEAMALASPTHQDGIAQAIVDGMVEYVQRSGISSY